MNQIETKEISFYLKNGESNLSSNYFIYHSSKPLMPKKSAKKILPQIGSQQIWQKKKELSKEEFLKNYLIKKRKKTMIISKYLGKLHSNNIYIKKK
jgi:3-hydroxy-3-methylglutaryl CoA synthase